MLKKQQQLTRLGDILVSKGLITKEQLARAILEQSKRKRLLDPADTKAQVTPLGEILIELGFIDHIQLKRGLNWQQRLRNASIAMALCAPFMMFIPNIARAAPAPITIEAENYSTMSGVYNENTTDIGGGKDAGNIATGDWMTYNDVVIPTSGTYTITYRVASLSLGGSFQLKTGDGEILDTVTVPVTGGWQTWVDVTTTVELTAGTHDLTILAKSGKFNINWFRIEYNDPAPAVSSSSSSAISFPPVLVQAENFTSMSGVYVESTKDEGGGQDVGSIGTGDWMTYNGIALPVSGTYKITYRVASLSAGGIFQLKSDTGEIIDTVTVPITGGWQTWVDLERTVTLPAGSNNLTIRATKGLFNVNWFKIENLTTTVTSSSASSVVSSVSSSASSVATSSSTASSVSSSKSSVASSSSSVASSASSSTASTLAPGAIVVEAENYATMSGVYNETTKDVGGGKNVGNIHTGEWMNYSNTKVSFPFTGKYKVTYRVSSLNGGGNLALNDANSGETYHTIAIPKTGGWQTWVDVSTEVDFSEGDHFFTIFAKTGGFNINWFKFEPIGTPMPLTIEAENFSAMSGVYVETTKDVGGGKDVGNIHTGEWMDYKNIEVLIPATASYRVTYRVASLSAGGKFTLHEAGGTEIFDTVTVPVTGGWQTWTSVERIVTLPAGKHFFGVKALLGGFNLNWIKLEPVDQSSTISPPPVTSSVSSSSSSAANVSSSSSSKPSSTSSSSWSSSSAPSNVQHVAGPVGITWTPPTARENGTYLDISDLGGYEIRYKKATDTNFTYISINDAWTTSYQFNWLEGDYVFQIAAFDKNGVYSPFVDIHRL